MVPWKLMETLAEASDIFFQSRAKHEKTNRNPAEILQEPSQSSTGSFKDLRATYIRKPTETPRKPSHSPKN